MSLIIKGMDMPEKCENCPCYDYIDYVCRADDCFAPFDVENPEERSEHCPLIEIPTPHGRLIDADNVSSDAMCSHCVEEYCRNNCECFIENVQTILSNELITPTIIEAEVSE